MKIIKKYKSATATFLGGMFRKEDGQSRKLLKIWILGQEVKKVHQLNQPGILSLVCQPGDKIEVNLTVENQLSIFFEEADELKETSQKVFAAKRFRRDD